MLADVVVPLPVKLGKAAQKDNQCERKGTAVVLLAYNVDTRQRDVEAKCAPNAPNEIMLNLCRHYSMIIAHGRVG